uniref:Uncharacterized protein n=1 Tax=Kalanchoe fedtschenkoi TaxID=63787 RepID=A0A7N0UI27_KALFE
MMLEDYTVYYCFCDCTITSWTDFFACLCYVNVRLGVCSVCSLLLCYFSFKIMMNDFFSRDRDKV